MTSRTPRAGNSGAPAIGDLIHRFSLETPVRTPDASGGSALTWALTAEVWGSLTAKAGGERAVDDHLKAAVTHIIALRYRPDITPDRRLSLGQRHFAIRAVLDRDGRQRFLECHCEEVVS